MAFKCFLCGKGPSAGKTISHSHTATNRVFKPNLHRQRMSVNGKTVRKLVCSTCIRSGKVKKVI